MCPDLSEDTPYRTIQWRSQTFRQGSGGRPVIQGVGGGLQKKFFPPFGPQFGLKIRGGPPPLDPPLPLLQTTTSCKQPLRYSHFGWSLMGRTLDCKYIIKD